MTPEELAKLEPPIPRCAHCGETHREHRRVWVEDHDRSRGVTVSTMETLCNDSDRSFFSAGKRGMQ